MVEVNEVLRWLQETALWLWGQWQVKVLVSHVLLNAVVALAATIKTGEFVLAKVPEFLYKKILPLVGVYTAFAAFGEATGQTAIATTAWGLLETALTSDLFDNLKKLGVAIPEPLTKERLA